MNNIVKILLLPLTVFLFCCQPSNNQENTEKVVVDIAKVEKLDTFYPSISDYEFVELQEDSIHKLGKVDKILFDKESIYVCDMRRSKAIFIYNKMGVLMNIVNNLGRGVGEYTNISDFDIDKLTNDIYILDPQLRKIFIYDSNGIFIRDIKLDFIATGFVITDKYLIFDKTNLTEKNNEKVANDNLLVCDRQGKILKGLMPIEEGFANYSIGSNGLQKNSKTISYLPSLSSCIYYYDIDQIELINNLCFDFGDKWPDKNLFIQKQNPAKILKLLREKNLIVFLNYVENEKFISLTFDHDKDKVLACISKKDQYCRLYNTTKAPFYFLPFTDYNGRFLSVIYPEQIENWGDIKLSVPENIKKSKSIVLLKFSLNDSRNEIK